MKIMVINPNTSAAMTQDIAQAARDVAAAGTEIIAVKPADGPESVEGHYDDVYAAVGVLDCIRQAEGQGIDGYLIACGNDPALAAAREMVRAPVLGIGEAAMHVAAMLGGHFSVITTLARTNVQLEDNVLRYGMSHACRSVRDVALPVLALEGDEAYRKMRDVIIRAIENDAAETVVLACAGMASMANRLTAELSIPVIDGVQSGVKLLEGIVGLGLGTSKVKSFALPGPKAYAGRFADAAPPPGRR